MAKFKKGDFVKAVNRNLIGEILSIHNDIITVLGDDCDFPEEFQESELILNIFDRDFKIDYAAKKKLEIKNRSIKRKKIENKCVDLHHNKLIGYHPKMKNIEILELQLQKFREEMKLVISQKRKKITFIHGIGENILKQRILEELLKRYKDILIKDRIKHSLDGGATTFEFHHKQK